MLFYMFYYCAIIMTDVARKGTTVSLNIGTDSHFSSYDGGNLMYFDLRKYTHFTF